MICASAHCMSVTVNLLDLAYRQLAFLPALRAGMHGCNVVTAAE